VIRRHYHLPPNDPRVLALTEEELSLEVELLYALHTGDDLPDPELRECDRCHGQTYRTYCPWCPDAQPLTLLERLVAREQAGEAVDWKAEYDDVIWAQVDATRA
jgi:hypothetical protein